MSDDITLERFRKKGGRWAYQLDDTPTLTVIEQNSPTEAYKGGLSAQARRDLGEPDHVNVYTGDDPPILAFEPTDDPDGDAYTVNENGQVSLTAILKQGFDIQPEGKWRIEGDYDDERDLLLFDLSPLMEDADG